MYSFGFSLFLLAIFWLIHANEKLLYSFYYWQIKEYRFDRIKGDLKRSFSAFLSKISVLAIIILALLPVSLIIESFWLWQYLVTAIFYALGVISAYKLFKKHWKLPKFTKKMMLLVLFFEAALLFATFTYLNNFLLFGLLAEILIPFLTFLLTQIIQIPVIFIKKIIYKKAEEKIRQRKDLTVIAINGSFGKSSTKEFLYTILSKKYKVLKTEGNTNTEIGVAQTINNHLKPEHKVFIVEMGAYRKGEIKIMCQMTQPKIGVVTGVNEQHLSLFGSMYNLLMAEGGGELSEFLNGKGTLFLNGDNKYCLDLYKIFKGDKKLYSQSNKILDSDIWADEIVAHKEHVSFIATGKHKEMALFRANVLGKQNVQNLLGAILVAKHLGMNFSEISEAVKHIKQSQAGMTLERGRHGIEIIDSSYSSNPDGVFADLDYLSIFPKKKIIVMPCLIELGKRSGLIHENIGRKIAEICDIAIITTKDKFEDIKRGAIKAGMLEKNVLLCDNSEDIYSIMTLFCKADDAVLLEGRVPKKLIDLLK